MKMTTTKTTTTTTKAVADFLGITPHPFLFIITINNTTLHD